MKHLAWDTGYYARGEQAKWDTITALNEFLSREPTPIIKNENGQLNYLLMTREVDSSGVS